MRADGMLQHGRTPRVGLRSGVGRFGTADDTDDENATSGESQRKSVAVSLACRESRHFRRWMPSGGIAAWHKRGGPIAVGRSRSRLLSGQFTLLQDEPIEGWGPCPSALPVLAVGGHQTSVP